MLELIDGIYCTPDGIKLLEEQPDFIESVWNNPKHRSLLCETNDTHITKIGSHFVEKQANPNEWGAPDPVSWHHLLRYARVTQYINECNLNDIRAAKTYFGDEQRILLELLDTVVDQQEIFEKDISEEAKESVYKMINLCRSEYAITPERTVVILDPHYI